MSPESLSLETVSELIRLALTPAFLIAAVSSMLGVLSSLLFVLAIAVLAVAMMCVLAEVGFASAAARNLVRDLTDEIEEPAVRHASSG